MATVMEHLEIDGNSDDKKLVAIMTDHLEASGNCDRTSGGNCGGKSLVVTVMKHLVETGGDCDLMETGGDCDGNSLWGLVATVGTSDGGWWQLLVHLADAGGN
ncbi:Hypothetical predicted protein [Octopus vulgaris]|uniref:Uncharacterized protein n=1 Tax=Octopus vulgaris TaxID=6645 RepID=A0AA36FFT3_OCTVU|nr:Hypothetical predicted protein [Octopus vulgaris]